MFVCPWCGWSPHLQSARLCVEEVLVVAPLDGVGVGLVVVVDLVGQVAVEGREAALRGQEGLGRVALVVEGREADRQTYRPGTRV